MKRRIVMILLVIFSFALQSTLLKQIAIGSISPNFIVILTASFALMRGKKEGMFVGFLSGLLIDIFSGGAIGFHALMYSCVGYANGFCYRIFYDDDIKMPIFLVAVSDFAVNLVFYIVRFLLRGRLDFFYYFGRILIPEVIYTMILTMLCYKLLYMLNKRLEKAEQRSVDSFV